MFSPENALYHKFLAPHLCENFILQSRIHKLNTFGENVFVKRDDELSSGITGSKYRKFASLIPFLVKENFDEVLLIGSAQSNNITGLLQLFREENINPKLMLLQSNETDLKGNLLWMSLLYNMVDVIWITRSDWKNVNELAADYQHQHTDKKIFIVNEGAANAEALPGAMTLATDILAYENQHRTKFDTIFMDSGSATSAIGLLYGFALADVKDKNIYITLIAGSEADFQQQYKKLVSEAAAIYSWPEKYFEGKIIFSRSAIAPSFGSVTRQVLDEVKYLALQEGILAEPIYTAKHFYTARQIMKDQNTNTKSLIINSGGSLGLSGFQEKLKPVLY